VTYTGILTEQVKT